MFKILKLFLKGKKNNVGKGENVGNQHFCHFPESFLTPSPVRLFLPNDKILHWSKFKAFEGNKIDAIEKQKFFLKCVENIVGKGEHAGHRHVPLFSQCFQKASYRGVVKSWDCVV